MRELVDKLNRAWWTSFWSHRYTEWEQIEPVDGSVQGFSSSALRNALANTGVETNRLAMPH